VGWPLATPDQSRRPVARGRIGLESSPRRAPVPELLTVRRVGDPPEVRAVRSDREDVLLVAGAPQDHGNHDPLAVGRPSRLEREGAAGTGVQRDPPESAAIRADDVELPSMLAEQQTVGYRYFRLTFTCLPRHWQVIAVNADDHPARASCG